MFSNISVNKESITLVKGDKILSENLDRRHKDSAFSFRHVSLDEITKEIKRLDAKKACQDTDIPTKVIKNNSDIFADFFFLSLNNCIVSSVFPSNFKNAEITPLHKKDSKNTESNYRPVRILSNISKIYEKCIFSQISNYFEKILSRYQFGFRKGHSTQQCLLVMIEKLRQSLDKGGHYGALLTDLSKAFNCLSHDLLIAITRIWLHVYGFDIPALRLLHNYTFFFINNQKFKQSPRKSLIC